jgi:hypothetical protein
MLFVEADAANILDGSALATSEVTDAVLDALPLAEAPSHRRKGTVLIIYYESQRSQSAARHP